MKVGILAVSATILFLNACSDDPARPARRIHDGATLSGRVSASFEAYGPEGSTAQPFGTPSEYTAPVEGGVARSEQPAAPALSLGRVVAVSDGVADEAPSTRTRSFLDDRGKRAEVTFEYLGKRNVGITYRVDGELTASIAKQWRRDGGGWVLERAEITSYERGEARARLALMAENIQVAQRASVSGMLAFVASGAAGLVLPTPLQAQDCSDEKLDVGVYGALSTISCGTGMVFACAGSMYAFYRALDALEECVSG